MRGARGDAGPPPGARTLPSGRTGVLLDPARAERATLLPSTREAIMTPDAAAPKIVLGTNKLKAKPCQEKTVRNISKYF